MLNTRCPHCGTTFRVKPEQLRARNGRVRCGHCQAPFNALAALIEGQLVDSEALEAATEVQTPPVSTTPDSESRPEALAEESETAPPPISQAPQQSRPDAAGTVVDAMARSGESILDAADLPASQPTSAAPPFGWRSISPPPRYTMHSAGDIAPPIPELDPAHLVASPFATLDFDLDAPDLPGSVPARSSTTVIQGTDWLSETHHAKPAAPDRHLAADNLAAQWDQATEIVPTTTLSLEDEEDESPAVAEILAEYSSPNLKSTADLVGETPLEEEAEDHIFDPPEHIVARAIEDFDELEPLAAADLHREPYAAYEPASGSASVFPDEAPSDEPPLSWDRERDVEPRRRTWPWVVSILVLLILGGTQALLWLRHDIARDFPATRPYFEQACAHLGCVMPWPRVTSLISIEASDLHPRGGREGSFELAGTLRNRADFAQAYPYLEVTLTDVFNRALVRKVLPPEEWLPETLKASPAFAPTADLAFTVYFDALDQPASGYKLYAFYP